MTEAINNILKERGKVYGDFNGHAFVSQRLKEILLLNRPKFTAQQREALEMIAHKLARIVNGDPNCVDSWHDIAGYAELVVRILEKQGEND